MASSDAIVPQTTYDALQQGRSSQIIVGMLLRFWDSKNITLLLIDKKVLKRVRSYRILFFFISDAFNSNFFCKILWFMDLSLLVASVTTKPVVEAPEDIL